MAPRPKVPSLDLPQPVVSEPSAHFILAMVRAIGISSQAELKAFGVPELGEPKNLYAPEPDTPKRMHVTAQTWAHLAKQGRSALIYALWSKYREAYVVHPEMSRSLLGMKSSTKVPMEVLQRLRHPNPLLLIPGALKITHPEGLSGRILAIQVAGAVASRFPYRPGYRGPSIPDGEVLIADTRHQDINAYSVTLLSEVHSPDGSRVETLDSCRLVIPIFGQYSVDELVERLSGKTFVWTGAKHEAPTGETRSKYLEIAAKTAISHLLYATSRTVDLDEKARNDRPPAKRMSGQPKPEKPARLRDLGFRVGAAIADFRRRQATTKTSGLPTGRTLPAHLRSAHLHMYLVGPGRQETDFKWLDPIPVNAHKDDGATVTMHPMKPERNR